MLYSGGKGGEVTEVSAPLLQDAGFTMWVLQEGRRLSQNLTVATTAAATPDAASSLKPVNTARGAQ